MCIKPLASRRATPHNQKQRCPEWIFLHGEFSNFLKFTQGIFKLRTAPQKQQIYIDLLLIIIIKIVDYKPLDLANFPEGTDKLPGIIIIRIEQAVQRDLAERRAYQGTRTVVTRDGRVADTFP